LGQPMKAPQVRHRRMTSSRTTVCRQSTPRRPFPNRRIGSPNVAPRATVGA
jgi:hypothetical protein